MKSVENQETTKCMIRGHQELKIHYTSANLVIIDTDNRLGVDGGHLMGDLLERQRLQLFHDRLTTLELCTFERHATLTKLLIC